MDWISGRHLRRRAERLRRGVGGENSGLILALGNLSDRVCCGKAETMEGLKMPKRVSLKGVARRWFAKLWVKEYPRLVWILDRIDVAFAFCFCFLVLCLFSVLV